MLSDSIKFTVEVECEQKFPFSDIRTEFNFEYRVYRNPINKNTLFHFFSFHDIKMLRISFARIMFLTFTSL